MKKLAFVGNSEPPARLLELFKKFTPGCSGIWKNLQGVDNYQEAEVFAVIDWLPPNLGIDESKCVFLGAHPETMQSYKDMSGYRGIYMYDCKKEFGFGEWWLKYTYDELKNLKPPEKSHVLAAIVSNAESQSYHKARLAWLDRFIAREPKNFQLWGRIQPKTPEMGIYYMGPCGSLDARGAASSGGNDHMSGKEETYSKHKYMLEFDATGANYFSERVFDCLLMWSMPIYWGGSGLHKYLPLDSFVYLDINGSGEDVEKIINTKNYYEDRIDAISKARDLLLNKYQIWPRVHQAIFGEA